MAERQRAVIVIPTYNEASCIAGLIQDLKGRALPACMGWDVDILVVDGCSTDGTAAIVRRSMGTGSAVHLLVEEKKSGIGEAYRKGFAYAIHQLSADVVIEFDGDCQHPPEAIPLLLHEIDGGADLVLGSRRVRGGAYPSGWGLYRRFISQAGGWVARLVLFFPTRFYGKVTDPTTGLKATRVTLLCGSRIMDHVRSAGFAYKIEMLFACARTTERIREIPLPFGLRMGGESKITGQTPREILSTVFRLRFEDPATRRFLKFAAVGFTGFLVNAVSLELLSRSRLLARLAAWFSRLALPSLLGFVTSTSTWAAVISAELSIIGNYILNNFWTFANRRRDAGFLSSGLRFNLVSVGAILIQAVIVGGATVLFGETLLIRQAALVCAIAFAVVPYNWFMYNHAIWRGGSRRPGTPHITEARRSPQA